MGYSDILALIENYMYYAHRPELPFLTSYCNVQDYCEKCLSVNDKSSQLGLSVCADMLAINFDVEEQHRAYADAELTLKCMKHFVEDYPIDDFIKDATNFMTDCCIKIILLQILIIRRLINAVCALIAMLAEGRLQDRQIGK